MADKIKEALFSMLGSLGIEPERVLDLYAGTGSLSIEALSRGASWADLVEQNGPAGAVIRDNLAHTGYQNVTRLHQTTVASFLARADGREEPYDLVILDPPYADPDILATVERVGASGLVQFGSVVVLGHWPRLKTSERLGRLALIRTRCHGDSCFSIYEVGDGEIETDATATATDHS
jgi:16S rRNA (guanine966-N2)-methyltransferase